MGIDLYYTLVSPPCRTVQLTANLLKVPLNIKEVDLQKGEHLKPEFVKLNPQHCVPTLVDGDFVLWESRAIITYLVNAYGKGSTLYPEDPKARAVVDARLNFDHGTLGPRFQQYFYPQILEGAPADEEKLVKVVEALKMFESMLEGQKFSAGDKLTVADLSLAVTISGFALVNIDIKQYKNINRWMQLVKKSVPEFEEYNDKGLQLVKHYMADAANKKK